MILLASDCLLFKTTAGELIPCSAELVTIELVGDGLPMVDPDIVRNAAASVLHYFRAELGRETVTVGEFSKALERVLRGFGLLVESQNDAPAPVTPAPRNAETSLLSLADEAGSSGELLFFPRLRTELRQQLQRSPRRMHFHGLRACARKLTGSRRWSPRCQTMHDQIVEFLRGCLSCEHPVAECSLFVR